MSPTADVRTQILEANRRAAEALRRHFAGEKTLVVNLISSPGAGKTTLLEATLARLGDRYRTAVLVGDIATEKDADRIRRLGLPAYQILTGGACHLDARQVQGALEKASFGPLDILFIENVGNLICPTSYDLGEDFKVVLLSLTEGDDKPFKYPAIFSRAAVAVLTKMDLLGVVDFDLAAVETQIRTLNPSAEILRVSAKTGEGMEAWCRRLERALSAKRG
ncbi:MAG: hydrogenase nickel incorporation protein HypB [Thermoanaerobaculum sp.]